MRTIAAPTRRDVESAGTGVVDRSAQWGHDVIDAVKQRGMVVMSVSGGELKVYDPATKATITIETVLLGADVVNQLLGERPA